jgi:phage FluMu gp28-like protein
MSREETYFLPYQVRWIKDQSRMKLCEKSRQIGISYADSYDSVRKVAPKDARLDVWVTSRDMIQAKQYLQYCKRWARILNYAAEDLGEVLVDKEKDLTAFCLKFANGLCIYSLSSSPDAIAGKTGHLKIDELALHKDQRELYRIAKPVTQWGGQLSAISTHRGAGTVFNGIIRDIKEKGNPMGWSLHTIPVHLAVKEGLVQRINKVTGNNETDEQWLARMRAECIDEEQWQQEYCCIPADDSTAFITYEMITACEDVTASKNFEYLLDCKNPLYVGVDVARKKHLAVIDVEEKVGDVYWERLRIEMQNKTFAEMEYELYRILQLPQVKRACIDGTGLGMQLAERAMERFRYKVESVSFTGPVKEELAFPLRAAHEDRVLRYSPSDALRADLRGIKKEVTESNNIRFVGDSEDSHCDRFWAKALAVHAGKKPQTMFACVG